MQGREGWGARVRHCRPRFTVREPARAGGRGVRSLREGRGRRARTTSSASRSRAPQRVSPAPLEGVGRGLGHATDGTGTCSSRPPPPPPTPLSPSLPRGGMGWVLFPTRTTDLVSGGQRRPKTALTPTLHLPPSTLSFPPSLNLRSRMCTPKRHSSHGPRPHTPSPGTLHHILPLWGDDGRVGFTVCVCRQRGHSPVGVLPTLAPRTRPTT